LVTKQPLFVREHTFQQSVSRVVISVTDQRMCQTIFSVQCVYVILTVRLLEERNGTLEGLDRILILSKIAEAIPDDRSKLGSGSRIHIGSFLELERRAVEQVTQFDILVENRVWTVEIESPLGAG